MENQLYCNTCDAGPWSEEATGINGLSIVKTHRNLKHDVIEYKEPEKSLEQQATEALRKLDPIQKITDSKESKKQDLLEDVVSFLKKEILQESDNIYLVLLNGLSAYSSNPINLRILAPSSEGKTYLVNKISKLFPKTDVVNLSTASAQSFKYLNGEKVVETETGDFESIEPKLIQLEMDYLDKSKSRQELESIRTEIIQLKKKLWYMIDLSNKWLIFSDSQDPGLWEMLKTLLSHDDEYIKHQVTNKIGGKNTAQKIVFKGKPAVTYCSAKDESKHQVSEEMDTRFYTIYLKTNPQKYKESIKLLSQKHGLPKLIYGDEVVSESEKLGAINKIGLLIENISQYGNETNCVFNPYASELAKNFPSESGLRSRQFDRFNQYITLMTLCYSFNRPKLRIDDKYYPVVTKSDILRTVEMMKESSAIPTNKIQFFNDIIHPAMIDIQNKEEFRVDLISGSKYVMTASEISDYAKAKHKKSNQDRKKILENYLEPLSEHGYLEMAQDPRNRTRNIYWIAKPYQDKKAGMESTLIDISTISDSGVRVYIEKYLKRRCDSGDLTIINKDCQSITPEQLYKLVTSIDICTTQNRHDLDNVETSTDVESRQS
jgi:ribosomal protein S8